MLYFALADNRLIDGTNGHMSSYRRDLNGYFDTDIAGWMNMRGHVNDDPNVDISELRVNERVDSGGRCRKAACGHWYAVTDSQLGRLPIQYANLGILNDLSGTVAQERLRRCPRQLHAIVAAGQMPQFIQGKSSVAGRF